MLYLFSEDEKKAITEREWHKDIAMLRGHGIWLHPDQEFMLRITDHLLKYAIARNAPVHLVGML